MKNKITILLLSVLALSATACNDWLDVRPSTEESVDVMFDSYQGYKDALTGCYIKMKNRDLYGENLTITTVEYFAHHWSYYNDGDIDATVEAFKNLSYKDDAVKSNISSIYSGLYNIIVQANTILQALPKTGATAFDRPEPRAIVEAEAHAIRAMCHFEILRLFGQVPGGTTQVRLPYSTDVSRENVKYYGWADFTGMIEDDLTKAEELLEEYDPIMTYTTSQTSGSSITDEFLRYRQLRLNYYAVKALQARFYLYIGNRTSDAYAAAMTVIDAANDGKGFTLATTSSFNSASRDYQLYAAPSECLFKLSNHQLKSYMSGIFTRGYGGGNSAWQIFLDTGDLEGPGMFEEPRGGATDIRLLHVWNFGMSNPYGQEMRQPKKYYQQDDFNVTSSTLMLDKQIMPMLRLSEMYFIAMETSSDLDEINALYEKFRVSRARTAITFTSKAEVLTELEKEYRRELFAEGQMFYWYKRHNSTSMLWSKHTLTETNYIVPLPDSEFDPNL